MEREEIHFPRFFHFIRKRGVGAVNCEVKGRVAMAVSEHKDRRLARAPVGWPVLEGRESSPGGREGS